MVAMADNACLECVESMECNFKRELPMYRCPSSSMNAIVFSIAQEGREYLHDTKVI